MLAVVTNAAGVDGQRPAARAAKQSSVEMPDLDGQRRRFGCFLALPPFNALYLVFERRHRVKSAPAQLSRFLVSIEGRRHVTASRCDITQRGDRRSILIASGFWHLLKIS